MPEDDFVFRAVDSHGKRKNTANKKMTGNWCGNREESFSNRYRHMKEEFTQMMMALKRHQIH